MRYNRLSKTFTPCLYIYFILFIINWGKAYTQTLNEIDRMTYNLSGFNSNIVNPAFSISRNRAHSFSLWSQWTKETIDENPSSLFANFSYGIDTRSTVGAGAYVFDSEKRTIVGVVLNYANTIVFQDDVNIIFGVNLLTFENKSLLNEYLKNSTILQLAPGMLFNYKGFELGLTVENALNYDLTGQVRQFGNRPLMVSMGKLIRLNGRSENPSKLSYVRPEAYIRTSSTFEQYGANILVQKPKFWIQGGYNSLYGASIGAGITFFDKFSLGTLAQTSPGENEKNTIFELIASYSLGTPKEKEHPEDSDIAAVVQTKKAEEKENLEGSTDSITVSKPSLTKAGDFITKNNLSAPKRPESETTLNGKTNDSLNPNKSETNLPKADNGTNIEAKGVATNREERKTTKGLSISNENNRVPQKEEEKLQRKFLQDNDIELFDVEGVQKGYYLVANVYATKKYFALFVRYLSDNGFVPKSFFRSENGYNYVYLERFDDPREALQARESNYYGRYKGDLWIFGVIK